MATQKTKQYSKLFLLIYVYLKLSFGPIHVVDNDLSYGGP